MVFQTKEVPDTYTAKTIIDVIRMLREASHYLPQVALQDTCNKV